jgi:hypothetical protein
MVSMTAEEDSRDFIPFLVQVINCQERRTNRGNCSTLLFQSRELQENETRRQKRKKALEKN